MLAAQIYSHAKTKPVHVNAKTVAMIQKSSVVKIRTAAMEEKSLTVIDCQTSSGVEIYIESDDYK